MSYNADKKAKLEELRTTTQKIVAELQQMVSNNRISESEDKVNALKLELCEFLTPTTANATSTEVALLENSRFAFEVSALLSLSKNDYAGFERSYFALIPFYFDMNQVLTKSSLRNQLISLRLLSLVASGDRSAFFCDLETLGDEDRNDAAIAFVAELEQSLEAGRFFDIREMTKNLPSPWHKPLFDQILSIIEKRILTLLEKSYKNVTAQDAMRLLGLSSENEIVAILKKHSNEKEKENDESTKSLICRSRSRLAEILGLVTDGEFGLRNKTEKMEDDECSAEAELACVGSKGTGMMNASCRWSNKSSPDETFISNEILSDWQRGRSAMSNIYISLAEDKRSAFE